MITTGNLAAIGLEEDWYLVLLNGTPNRTTPFDAMFSECERLR
jgi:hypothetical protein